MQKDASKIQEAEIIKKPVIVFCIADSKNIEYAKAMINSLRKFHDWPVVLFTDVKDIKLPNVTVEDLTPYLTDQMFFYRATPIIAQKYINDYELVLKIDADSIITGDLSYILDTKDYDIGTVINWNRIDPQTYGLVAGWGILPIEYFNCGFVAMRSDKFIKHWNVLCFTEQFNRLQYKEQDLLNALCYYGNYNVRCFDHGDGIAKMNAWWGLISKGEWSYAILKDNKIIIPKGQGDTPFPSNDMELKVLHFGEGNQPNKTNYRTKFSEDIIKRLDYLVSNKV